MHWGIDLGGTKIELIGLSAGSEQRYRKRVESPKGDYYNTITTLRDLIIAAEHTTGQIGTVGIGIPGCIDPRTQRVKNANSTWLIGHPLQQDLSAALQRPVAVANDADCFALSEATDGAASHYDCVFGVIMGTGVGGGISVQRSVRSGPNSIRGEWGHNALPWPSHTDSPARACYCGKTGCIETYLSGPGLLASYAVKQTTASHTSLPRDAASLARVEHLLALADAGDITAQQCIQAHVEQSAKALASVINVLDPDCIVLGGGLSNMPHLYAQLPERLHHYVFSDQCHTPILQAKFGDASGVRGAAWLGRHAPTPE